MLLAALQQVEKFYADQTILEKVNLELRATSRIALIGRNGAGKSTILNLFANRLEPDAGEVFRRTGVTVAKLEQDPAFPARQSILDISERAFVELDALEKELQALEPNLADHDVYEQWEKLHEVFERRGGYERRSRRDAVLYALGFRGREAQEAISLSGGEKTRLGLAQLLMAQPDVLLLDEPTNHLDMEMRGWLESYLSRYPGAVLLVSHDREFLDRACDATAEIAFGNLRSYPGNPSSYREYRAEQLEIEDATRKNEAREYERLQTMTKQMKIWGGRSEKLAKRALSMQKRTERYAETMLEEADPEGGTTRFQFKCESSGDIVLQAQALEKSFGSKKLFQAVEFTIRQGERIALVGPNGAGKSTFIKVLLGDVPSDNPAAVLRFGSRVRAGYYDQELRGVNPENTLIAEMIRLVGDKEAHNLLGRFLFPYDAQYKTIKDLSGGERARLALLKLTLGECNFLVLDEPTNHLDVEMIEALEDALATYKGTLLVISHDRRFIEATTDFVWELRDGALTTYLGDWQYYLSKKQVSISASQPSVGQSSAQALKNPQPSTPNAQRPTPSKWQLEKDITRLESEIETLERELSGVTEKLADASNLKPDEIADLGERHHDLEAELLETMTRWEEVSSLLSLKTS
ncbi:MAG: ribosomal protection-like ABC-F family protein [Trueperaceae bacterium]